LSQLGQLLSIANGYCELCLIAATFPSIAFSQRAILGMVAGQLARPSGLVADLVVASFARAAGGIVGTAGFFDGRREKRCRAKRLND
jgi:hypothetical protein